MKLNLEHNRFVVPLIQLIQKKTKLYNPTKRNWKLFRQKLHLTGPPEISAVLIVRGWSSFQAYNETAIPYAFIMDIFYNAKEKVVDLVFVITGVFHDSLQIKTNNDQLEAHSWICGLLFTPNQFRPLQVLSENHALTNYNLIFSFVIYYYRKELTSLELMKKKLHHLIKRVMNETEKQHSQKKWNFLLLRKKLSQIFKFDLSYGNQ